MAVGQNTDFGFAGSSGDFHFLTSKIKKTYGFPQNADKPIYVKCLEYKLKSDNHEQVISELEDQIVELKRTITHMTEAAKNASDHEFSWVYALEGNRDGVWDWNAITNEVFFSARWKDMLGYQEQEIANELSEWDKRVHPDDREAVYRDLNAHLKGETPYYSNEHRLKHKDGSFVWVLDRGKVMSWTEDNKPLRIVGTHTDITLRKEAELENKRLVKELSETIEKVKILSGMLPICASCKKVRDDHGYWNRIEEYIRDHSNAEFTHSICPDCAEKLYGELEQLGHQNQPTEPNL